MKYIVYPYEILIKHTSNGIVYVSKLTISEKIHIELEKIISVVSHRIRIGKMILDSTLEKLFEQLVKYLSEKISIVLRKKCNLTRHKLERLALYCTFKILKIENILAFLIDEKILEIYIDGPNTTIYASHIDFGRVNTNVVLSEEEISRLISLALFKSCKPLSYITPSTKVDINTRWFKLRISIDAPPLSEDGPTIVIRKHRNIPIHVRFIAHNKYKLHLLAILLMSIALRFNILVAGEPDSGKTTLASFLLSCTPNYWRIILIEDVKEIINLKVFGKKAIRLKVRPYEAKPGFAKHHEILKLLHRTPDYIFVGEIQSKEDSFALVDAFCSGVRGLATTHAKSIKDLLNRWCNIFKIHPYQLTSIDLICTTKRRISEKFIRRSLHAIYLITDRKVDTLERNLNELLVNVNLPITLTRFCEDETKEYKKINAMLLSMKIKEHFPEILDFVDYRALIDATYRALLFLEKKLNLASKLSEDDSIIILSNAVSQISSLFNDPLTITKILAEKTYLWTT